MHVRRLLVTPVKGLRVTPRDEVTLERGGVRENRRFFLVDERGTMVNAKTIGELSELVAEYGADEDSLALTFPSGERVSGRVSLDSEIDARFFRRTVRARVVLGPWSQAISTHVGRSLRLVDSARGLDRVAADPARTGVDRGRRGAVSLVSSGSLDRLAEVAGTGGAIDPRRFRMLVEVDGVDPHDEDAWIGRRVRVGEALVRFNGHVGRCLVTCRDPDTGTIDLPTLDLLREYRADAPSTEPLPFGIYGEVIEPGVVRVGDPVTAGSS